MILLQNNEVVLVLNVMDGAISNQKLGDGMKKRLSTSTTAIMNQ